MPLMKRCIFFFAVLFYWGTKHVSAQSNEIELDPVTITASLAQVKSSASGRSLIVVSGKQLQQLPVHSVDELLRYLPGIEVQSRGPMGTQSNITLRGGTFQQVLILIDGIRLNDPLTGHFNSYIPIAPIEIERIEILKGAASAIHGTEAVGGVVHIITKSFSAKENPTNKKMLAGITLGEYGLANVQAGAFIQKKHTAFAGGFIRNNANGQLLRGINGFFDLTTLSVSLKHQFNDHFSIAFRSAIDRRDFAAQNFFSTLLSDTATEKVNSAWSHLQIAYQKSAHRFTADIGFKQTKDEFRLRKSVPANINQSQLFQLLLQHEIKLKELTRITYGSQSIIRNLKSNDRGDHALFQSALFFTIQHKMGNLNINPALRLDYHENAGWQWVPQMNISYKKDKIQWRGMMGKTTRDADFTERFNNFRRNPVPSGNRMGNPSLGAETSFNYEVGGDYFLSNTMKLSATWFHRFHHGLIDWVRTPYEQMPRRENLIAGGTYFLSRNIARVNTYGIETDLQFKHQFNEKHDLSVNGGFILLRTISGDGTPSLYVSNHAQFLLNMSAIYRYKSFILSFNGLHKRRQPQMASNIEAEITPRYAVMNMRLEKSWFSGKCSGFIQIDNLFNVQYQDILGSRMPRRWLMSGIKLTL